MIQFDERLTGLRCNSQQVKKFPAADACVHSGRKKGIHLCSRCRGDTHVTRCFRSMLPPLSEQTLFFSSSPPPSPPPLPSPAAAILISFSSCALSRMPTRGYNRSCSERSGTEKQEERRGVRMAAECVSTMCARVKPGEA